MTRENKRAMDFTNEQLSAVRTVLSDGLTHKELRGMLARSAEGSDWLGPAMDVYDDYDQHR